MALLSVPDELKTPELCLAAVTNHPWALEFVPDGLKTPELCRVAVQQENSWSLRHVPDDLKTLELCLMAVQCYEPEFAPTLKFVPEALRTSELCLAAVKSNYHALYEVPREIVTEQFLRDVIEYNKSRDEQSYTYE